MAHVSQITTADNIVPQDREELKLVGVRVKFSKTLLTALDSIVILFRIIMTIMMIASRGLDGIPPETELASSANNVLTVPWIPCFRALRYSVEPPRFLAVPFSARSAAGQKLVESPLLL